MLNVRRRQFLTLLGGAAAWPLAARAQQPKVPTIGVLVIGNISPEEFWREFRQGLRDLGYIEGQNIRFEFRSAEGQIDRLPELAAELVRLKVDVIVTWFTPTAVAAAKATREIPIVMAETGDPIGTRAPKRYQVAVGLTRVGALQHTRAECCAWPPREKHRRRGGRVYRTWPRRCARHFPASPGTQALSCRAMS
jgi:ABC-type uncharacterized transport system substrate-binding protein